MKPLTDRQRIAAKRLAAGRYVTAAAAEIGVHRATVHRWLQRPDFAALVEAECERRRASFEAEMRDRISQNFTLGTQQPRRRGRPFRRGFDPRRGPGRPFERGYDERRNTLGRPLKLDLAGLAEFLRSAETPT